MPSLYSSFSTRVCKCVWFTDALKKTDWWLQSSTKFLKCITWDSPPSKRFVESRWYTNIDLWTWYGMARDSQPPFQREIWTAQILEWHGPLDYEWLRPFPHLAPWEDLESPDIRKTLTIWLGIAWLDPPSPRHMWRAQTRNKHQYGMTWDRHPITPIRDRFEEPRH